MPRTHKIVTPPPAPASAVDPQGLIRLENPGKWLAWTEKTLQLIASGDTPDEVRALAEKRGHRRFIYDWVPPIEADAAVGPS